MIKVEKEGVDSHISLVSFEKITGTLFRPNLYFQEEKVRKKIIKQTRALYRKGELTRRQLWMGSYYRQEIESPFIPDVVFRWIDETVGWGLFADRAFRKGEFIGEYGGVLRKRKREDRKNSYCFQYAISEEHFPSYNIDARDRGGVTRWINHSFQPNLLTTLATFDEVTHIILVVNEPIPKGAQLFYDYGKDYWAARKGLKIL